MLQKNIAKKILGFCIGTLLLNASLAQRSKYKAENWQSFIASAADTGNTSYHLLVASADFVSAMEHAGQLTVVRSLNDSVYIIQLQRSRMAFPGKQLYSANNTWKLSPSLLPVQNYSGTRSLLIGVTNGAAITQWAVVKKISLAPTPVKNIFIADAANNTILNALLQRDEVTFISEYNRHPKEELQINNLDLSVNKINVLHSKMPGLNGTGQIISIKENKPDTTDIDLRGRYLYNNLAATAINPHATIMATMAAGAGNSYYLGGGVAPGASITSSSFSNLLPDADGNYSQNKINVQNHSYGVGVENFYGADAAAFDASALTNDKLLFVFSAGNSGTATPTDGNYAGIAGVSNLTGSFKMAKNIITVGAVDSFNTVVGPSSKGPAYDGRIKPEMVAYGEDGSSGAAALVSGTAATLQQAYKNNNGNLPPAALVKAVLLNSCDDVAANGIDFTSGFGSLNAYKAAEGIMAQRYFTGSVSNNSTQKFTVTIPANISKAKFTLVWYDVPATANAFKAIKNDLDLQVQSVASSQVWLPWVLNSVAHKDSLLLLPVRKRDSLNTIEQVSIDNPVAGSYDIIINGFSVGTATQNFAVAYQFDTTNVFNWTFPSAVDNIFPAANNLLRWNTNFASTAASLAYSINNGASWINIPGNINTSNNNFRWAAPDTNTVALLKMTVGSNQFISDPFTISARPLLNIGFNCADSVLLYWNKNKGITDYQLYGMGTAYLQPLSVIKDTQYIFNKTTLNYQDFAIAPIIKNQQGVKSYATNYNNQGVDCYIKNLLADLINDNGALQLEIGSTYLVNKIVIEKLSGAAYSPIFETTAINGLHYATTDTHLQKGLNNYRAVIYLSNGKIIYSDIATIVFFAGSNVLIYPNPVQQNNIVTLQFSLLNNQTITITDVLGRQVLQKKSSASSITFPAVFAKGLYFITINDPEKNTSQVSKILVQ